MFVRTESFEMFRKYYPVVTFFLGLQLIIFLLYKLSFFGLGSFIYQWGVGSNALIAEGQWWRLLTAIFLHANIPHVLFNSFSIFLFAPALETILGKNKFIIAFLGTGILGNLGTLFVGPLTLSYLGSSGAIFGLFGIYLYMVLYKKDYIDSSNAQVITTILIISLIMTFLQPNIDISGHLFGLVAGFIMAPFLFGKRKQRI